MKKTFRRWLGAVGVSVDEAGRALIEVQRWAQACGHRFAVSRGGEGFVIEPQDGAAWRLEWGPPQRFYVMGAELRIRADVGEHNDLQMLVATQPLMAQLEHEIYEQATEGRRTRVDEDTPEEMRWLVLHRKLSRSELGTLRERFGALAQPLRAAQSWLDGALAQQLDTSASWLAAEQPLAMVVQRGRFVLRLELPHPSVAAVTSALALATTAAAAARRVAGELERGRLNSVQPGP